MYDAMKLQRMRIGRGIGIPELAEKAGVTPQTIYRFEKGAVMRPATIRKIAIALNCEVSEFLTDEILKGA